MATFEVVYKIVEDTYTGNYSSTGPSHYTIVVEAIHQMAAEQMVRNMNGGDRHCHIQYARHLSN